jgi:hypothetical protein
VRASRHPLPTGVSVQVWHASRPITHSLCASVVSHPCRYERGRWKRGPNDPPLPPSDFVPPESAEEKKIREKEVDRERKKRERKAREKANADALAQRESARQAAPVAAASPSLGGGLDLLFGAPSAPSAPAADPFGSSDGGFGDFQSPPPSAAPQQQQQQQQQQQPVGSSNADIMALFNAPQGGMGMGMGMPGMGMGGGMGMQGGMMQGGMMSPGMQQQGTAVLPAPTPLVCTNQTPPRARSLSLTLAFLQEWAWAAWACNSSSSSSTLA